jgi:hypothetical protein
MLLSRIQTQACDNIAAFPLWDDMPVRWPLKV